MSPTVSETSRAWATFAFEWAVGNHTTPPSGPVPVNQIFRLGLNEIVASALLSLTDERCRELEASYRNSVAHNVGLLNHLKQVAKTFEQEEIPLVAVKGVAMLLRFPDRLDQRRMTDLDILVPPNKYALAQAVLRKLGGVLVDRGRPITEMWSSERMFRFEQTVVPTVVDIHRGLHHWPLWSNLTNTIVGQTTQFEQVSVPTKVNSILVIAAHRARNGFSGDCRELIDFRVLLRHFGDSDWANLLLAAQACDMVGAVYALWRLSRWWCSTPIPGEVEGFRALESQLGVFQKRAIERWAGPDERIFNTIPKTLPYLTMYAGMPLAAGRLLPVMLGLGVYSSSRVLDTLITSWRHRSESR